MNGWKLLRAVVLSAVFLCAVSNEAQAAIILDFDYVGASSNTAPLTATDTLDPNLILTAGLNLGTGAFTGNAPDANEFNVRGHTQSSSLATAIASGDFIGFTIEPDATFNMDLTDITFNLHRHGVYAASLFAVFSSVDGFTDGDQLATFEVLATGSANDTALMTSLSFTSITAATEFRMYGYGSGNDPYGQTDWTKTTISGTVVPEPASLILVGIGSAIALLHRRRASR